MDCDMFGNTKKIFETEESVPLSNALALYNEPAVVAFIPPRMMKKPLLSRALVLPAPEPQLKVINRPLDLERLQYLSKHKISPIITTEDATAPQLKKKKTLKLPIVNLPKK